MEARDQGQMSPSTTLFLIFYFRQGLSLSLDLIVLARLVWPKSPWDPPVSVPSVLLLQTGATTPSFYMDAGDLNSGLHAYTKSTLPITQSA